MKLAAVGNSCAWHCSNGQSGLDLVLHVVAIDQFMNAHGLLANGVQECGWISGEDLSDAGVAELCVQQADDGSDLFRRAAAAGTLDGLDGMANTVDAETDGVGKVAIEKEELENALGRDVGGVDLAVSFKGSTTAQQADEFEILVARTLALLLGRQFLLIDLKQSGGGIGALKIATEADELPSLAVDHGGVTDPFEQMNAINDGRQRVVDAGAELGLGVGRV